MALNIGKRKLKVNKKSLPTTIVAAQALKSLRMVLHLILAPSALWH